MHLLSDRKTTFVQKGFQTGNPKGNYKPFYPYLETLQKVPGIQYPMPNAGKVSFRADYGSIMLHVIGRVISSPGSPCVWSSQKPSGTARMSSEKAKLGSRRCDELASPPYV
ncbi:hypothetical protein NHX12_009886 [Muraenolepis orangiensis]|uniref:Uncharacterized protein n=1 Tax=Muraenolepis orangiensis TaxID=630683 RepID=A0A9Q0DK70_9TELE|nr:hypothetical protein NHX12_009886 [Muraenolepis orangiensis]